MLMIEAYKMYESYKYGIVIYKYISDYIERKKKLALIEKVSKLNTNDDGWELI